jgi:hypothetical protein
MCKLCALQPSIYSVPSYICLPVQAKLYTHCAYICAGTCDPNPQKNLHCLVGGCALLAFVDLVAVLAAGGGTWEVQLT